MQKSMKKIILNDYEYDALVQALLTLAYADNYDEESYTEGQEMALDTLTLLGE